MKKRVCLWLVAGMLAASGSLPSYQEDLIDDAIFSVQNGSEYRAQQTLKTMMRNYQNEGNSEAARPWPKTQKRRFPRPALRQGVFPLQAGRQKL